MRSRRLTSFAGSLEDLQPYGRSHYDPKSRVTPKLWKISAGLIRFTVRPESWCPAKVVASLLVGVKNSSKIHIFCCRRWRIKRWNWWATHPLLLLYASGKTTMNRRRTYSSITAFPFRQGVINRFWNMRMFLNKNTEVFRMFTCSNFSANSYRIGRIFDGWTKWDGGILGNTPFPLVALWLNWIPQSMRVFCFRLAVTAS